MKSYLNSWARFRAQKMGPGYVIPIKNLFGGPFLSPENGLRFSDFRAIFGTPSRGKIIKVFRPRDRSMKEGSEGGREDGEMGKRVYGEGAGEGSEGTGRDEVRCTVRRERRHSGEKEKGRTGLTLSGVHGRARGGNETSLCVV